MSKPEKEILTSSKNTKPEPPNAPKPRIVIDDDSKAKESKRNEGKILPPP